MMPYAPLKTPAFIVDQRLIDQNLAILKYIMDETGVKILLAQKAFSMYHTYGELSKILKGTCASGLHEAKLAKQYFKGEVHTFSAAYRPDEIDEILALSDHVVFNSFNQWKTYQEKAQEAGKSYGIRINPEYSTQGTEHAIYDPCSPMSRLGVKKAHFDEDAMDGISGLHFHTLCQQNVTPFRETLQVFEGQYGHLFSQLEWVNFGGGHHITRADYDVEGLIHILKDFSARYPHLTLYMEPGEAVVLNTGFLVTTILDIIPNTPESIIVDTSAACHMPDVLEMPYRPHILGSGEENAKANTYHFGGPTCLAGDMIGTYSFDQPLKIGDRLTFTDMALYSMVKTNTFNGMNLPDIIYVDREGTMNVIKSFGYDDFESRL